MAESVALTKSTGGDYQIVVGGVYSYTKQFPAADYRLYGIVKIYNCA